MGADPKLAESTGLNVDSGGSIGGLDLSPP